MYRDVLVDECKPSKQGWLWPADDTGLWDGPAENWPTFKQAIMRFVQDNKVVVQAGGGCGMYPRLLSRMFETVYTFEPTPFSFYCLNQNCAEPNIIKLNAALGESHQMVKVKIIDPTNHGCNSIETDSTANIPQLMIDDLALPACDFIMLDIEGYEIFALIGAQQTIALHKPVISCENGFIESIKHFMFDLEYIAVGTFHADTWWVHRSKLSAEDLNLLDQSPAKLL